jgi:hypothetical protein
MRMLVQESCDCLLVLKSDVVQLSLTPVNIQVGILTRCQARALDRTCTSSSCLCHPIKQHWRSLPYLSVACPASRKPVRAENETNVIAYTCMLSDNVPNYVQLSVEPGALVLHLIRAAGLAVVPTLPWTCTTAVCCLGHMPDTSANRKYIGHRS